MARVLSNTYQLSIVNYTLLNYTQLAQIIDKQMYSYAGSMGLREHQQSIDHTLKFERISYRDNLAELSMRLFK